MFTGLKYQLNDFGRETPEKETPYTDPTEPQIVPTEIPVIIPPEKQDDPLPEKQDEPLPETPPIKPQ